MLSMLIVLTYCTISTCMGTYKIPHADIGWNVRHTRLPAILFLGAFFQWYLYIMLLMEKYGVSASNVGRICAP